MGEAPVVLSIPAQAGDYLRIDVEQLGVDAVVVLRGADGEQRARTRRISGRRGVEVIELTSDVVEVLSLEISSRYPSLDRGKVRVSLVARRPPSKADGRRLFATQAMERGAGFAREREWSKASAELEQSVRAWRELGDASRELVALHLQGQVFVDSDRFEDALVCYVRAWELGVKLDDPCAMSRTLHGRGNAYLPRGKLLAALSDYDRSTELAQLCGDHVGIAGSRMNSGLVHYRLGEPEEALSDLQAANAGFLALGREFGLSHTYRGVAQAFMALGDSTRAREALDRGLEAAKRFPFNRAALLRELGRLHLRHFGDPERARKAFDEAAALFREVRADSHLAGVLHWRGLAFAAVDEFDKANADHQAALQIQNRIGARSGAADSLGGLARVAARRRQWARARELFARAVAEQEALHRTPALVEILDEWARMELSAGQVTAARVKSNRALELVESIREEVERLDLLTTFAGTVRAVFDTAVDIALETPSSVEARAAASFAVAERGRTRTLVETLSLASRGDAFLSVDPKIRAGLEDARRTLRQDMIELRRGLESAGEEEVDALEQSVVASIDAYETWRSRAIRTDRSEWLPASPSLDEVRNAMGERSALLAYSLRDEESTVWLLTGRTLTAQTLPGRSTLESAARALHESLTARSREQGRASWLEADAAARKKARSLADMILPSLPAGLDHLYVVADGGLHLAPFALLLREKEALESLPAVVATPSTSALVLLARRRRPLKPNARVTVLADPVFDLSDPRLSTAEKKPSQDSPSTLRAPQGLNFGRLRFSRTEAEVIRKAFPSARVYVDFLASPSMLAAATGSDILHVASHAILNTQRPELGGLVLSLFDEDAKSVNGFVRMHDLYDLRFPGALVVLSACQTALGRQVRGEGVVGLSRGFLFSGARAVLSTLWSVDDRGTAELMRHFYGALLAGEESPAAALREAQSAMQQSERFRAPYYWAGFVLQGA
ncbi:MAG: CHAT domain-containing protein [Myxococcota bacterium]